MTMQMQTPDQTIAQAIAERAAITVDHETKRFVGFRFKLSTAPRATVVRVSKDTSLCASLIALAA